MVWSVSSDKWKVPFIERPSRVLKTKFTFWPTQWSHSPWFISFKYFKNGPAIASASLLPASLSMRQMLPYSKDKFFQHAFVASNFEDFLHTRHKLLLLTSKTDWGPGKWSYFEVRSSPLLLVSRPSTHPRVADRVKPNQKSIEFNWTQLVELLFDYFGNQT